MTEKKIGEIREELRAVSDRELPLLLKHIKPMREAAW